VLRNPGLLEKNLVQAKKIGEMERSSILVRGKGKWSSCKRNKEKTTTKPHLNNLKKKRGGDENVANQKRIAGGSPLDPNTQETGNSALGVAELLLDAKTSPGGKGRSGKKKILWEKVKTKGKKHMNTGGETLLTFRRFTQKATATHEDPKRVGSAKVLERGNGPKPMHTVRKECRNP